MDMPVTRGAPRLSHRAPEHAEAVVIGGGVFGCSAALHLLRAGVDVLLLEREQLGSGTSSAGAGMITMWGAGFISAWDEPEELEAERYGLHFYADLAEDEFDLHYKKNGALWLARDEQTWKEHSAGLLNHPAASDRYVLTPQEVEQLTGIVAGSAVVGGVFEPQAARVSAPHAARALAHQFVREGGRLRTGTPVERIIVENDRIAGVETNQGAVKAPVAVCATGAWTNSLLRRLGIWLPMVPLVLSRLLTEPIGAPPTMPNLLLAGIPLVWIREEQSALLWGCGYEATPRYMFIDDDPPKRFDRLPLDGVKEVEHVGDTLADVVPALSGCRTVTVAHGAPCYTPDFRPLVGSVPGISGLYAMAGCNEAGVTHGPGLGRLLAAAIVERTDDSGVLPGAFSPKRFGDRYHRGSDVVSAIEVRQW